MREEELRSEVTKRRTFTDGTWDYLRDRGYVGEALDKGFDEEALQQIMDEIDALAKAYPYESSRVPSGEVHTKNLAQELEDSDGEQGDYFEVELGEYERER